METKTEPTQFEKILADMKNFMIQSMKAADEKSDLYKRSLIPLKGTETLRGIIPMLEEFEHEMKTAKPTREGLTKSNEHIMKLIAAFTWADIDEPEDDTQCAKLQAEWDDWATKILVKTAEVRHQIENQDRISEKLKTQRKTHNMNEIPQIVRIKRYKPINPRGIPN